MQKKIRSAKTKNTLGLRVEKKFWKQGIPCVIGLDEAGMGPLAGPVCAAAISIGLEFSVSDDVLASVYDSKKVPSAKREQIYNAFVRHPAVRYATATVSARTIDAVNIRNAGALAMKRAAEKMMRTHALAPTDCTAVIDGTVRLPDFPTTQQSVIRGDQKVYSVAAASIIAKVTRDRIMRRLDKKYPHYGFASHKGYGTAAHYRALKANGPSPEHRKTFL
jgi:ribonuclease HII